MTILTHWFILIDRPAWNYNILFNISLFTSECYKNMNKEKKVYASNTNWHHLSHSWCPIHALTTQWYIHYQPYYTTCSCKAILSTHTKYFSRANDVVWENLGYTIGPWTCITQTLAWVTQKRICITHVHGPIWGFSCTTTKAKWQHLWGFTYHKMARKLYEVFLALTLA